MQSQQYKDDKKYFNDTFDEIESGKIELIPFDDELSGLDSFIDNVK